MDAPFDHVGIVGLGFVGGSVALAARRRWPDIRITVCDPSPLTNEAVIQGLVEAVVTTPAALADCALIVIATPVQSVPDIVKQLHGVGVRALVTDVSSTKRVVMAAARDCRGLTFVGGHPVISGAGTGLAQARADVFDGRPWLLVSSSDGHESEASVAIAEAMLASLVVGLGARPEWTDAVTHDRVMAHVSQAPQVVAESLKPQADTSPSWQGVVDTNADFIADAIVALAAKLPTSADVLMENPAVRAIFDRARQLTETR